jgi:DNA polymerase-3 subunit alpha
VKCGAFSSLNAKRAQLLQILEGAVEMGQQTQQDKRAGQMNMFGAPAASAPSAARAMGAAALPDVDELPDAELLKFEKEYLGFYISSHPLTEHQSALEHYSTASTREAMNCSEGTEVTIGGMINRVKKVITKNGRSAGMPMAIITLEDLEGQIDGTMFAETYAEICQKYPDAVSAESIVFVRGKVDRKRETPSLLINEVIPIAESVSKLTTAIVLKLDTARHSGTVTADVEALLARHKGATPTFVEVTRLSTYKTATMKLDRERFLRPSRELVDDIEAALGGGSVQLCGAGTKRRRKLEQQQQPLFKQEQEESAEEASDEAAAAVLDAETEEAAVE